MYAIDELFDKRVAVGIQLEEMLLKQRTTKAKFCTAAGISRPTLNKLLSGDITNKVNFVHHMEKVLRCLSVTPDVLMGNIKNPYIQAKSLRNALRINIKEISNITGISAERLREIESGTDATIAELRDIAFCLGVGVKSILGESLFVSQVAVLADIVQQPEGVSEDEFSGFWGHIGILASHSETYLWYPVTKRTRNLVYQIQNKGRIIVPCMDNKLLYLNMRNVNSIVLLDDACDSPSFSNWDNTVNCGNIPQVVYECLDDYFYYENIGATPEPHEFSPKFMMTIKQIIEDNDWDEDIAHEIIDTITIHYINGEVVVTDIDAHESGSLSSNIEALHIFGGYASEEQCLVYNDYNGAEILINTDNVSVIELPLAKIEAAISYFNDEMKER